MIPPAVIQLSAQRGREISLRPKKRELTSWLRRDWPTVSESYDMLRALDDLPPDTRNECLAAAMILTIDHEKFGALQALTRAMHGDLNNSQPGHSS